MNFLRSLQSVSSAWAISWSWCWGGTPSERNLGLERRRDYYSPHIPIQLIYLICTENKSLRLTGQIIINLGGDSNAVTVADVIFENYHILWYLVCSC